MSRAWLYLARPGSTLASLASSRPAARLALVLVEPVEQRLPGRLVVHLGDARGERNVLGASLHAVPRLAAIADAALAHQRAQPLVLVEGAARVAVEEPRL